MGKIKSITIATTLCILVGCGGQTAIENINQGIENFDTGNLATAEINFKEALQQEPDNATARFMLGRLYAESGAIFAAQKELEKALRLGYDSAKVYRYLASVYYLQTDGAGLDSILEQVDSLPKNVQATVLAFDGMLDLEMDAGEDAANILNRLREQHGDSPYYQLLQAYMNFANSDVPAALELAEALVSAHPEMAEAHFMLGQLYSVSRQLPAAVTEFEFYCQSRPEDFRGAMYLTNAYVKNKQFDKAKPYIAKFLQINPEQPFTNFLLSIIQFDEENFEQAKLAAEKALQNGFDRTAVRVIAGLSAFRLENYEQAYNHLDTIKDTLPPESPVMSLLSALNLKLGYSENVSDIIGEKSELSDKDILLLSSATVDLVRAGNLEKATQAAELLDSAQTESELSLVAKGMARLSLEDLGGITDLESALSFAPESEIANSALANAYIDQKMYAEAIELAKRWQAENPDAPYGYTLEGLALIEQGRRPEAEASFQKALLLDKHDPLANNYFAEIAKQDGDINSAVVHFKAILSKRPTHQVALEKLKDIYLETDQPDKAFEVLDTALQNANESNRITLNLLYSRTLYEVSRFQDLIHFLEPMNNQKMPSQYWIYLSNAYLLLDNIAQAIAVSKEWIEVEPDNEIAWIRTVTLLDDTAYDSEALSLARRALSKFRLPVFSLLVTDLAIKTGDKRLARNTFEQLPGKDKVTALGKLIEGEISLAEGQRTKALVLLEASYDERPADRALWLIAKAYLDAGDTMIAYQKYNQHVDMQESAVSVLMQYGELAVINQDYDNAIAIYKQVLSREPNDMMALNNLAFALIENGQAHEAVAMSTRAFNLAGGINTGNVTILDTHATALWKAQQYDEAITILEQLYRLMPNNKNIIRKLASVLKDSGHSQQAAQLSELIE